MNGQAPTARRVTKQRLALQTELDRHDDFRTAQEIHACLLEHGDAVSLATVYRVLQQLAEDGAVDVMRLTDGETGYRRCAVESHHHHLVCRVCGATEEVEAPEVEAWAASVAARFGYSQVGHTVELTGLCAACAARQRAAGASGPEGSAGPAGATGEGEPEAGSGDGRPADAGE